MFRTSTPISVHEVEPSGFYALSTEVRRSLRFNVSSSQVQGPIAESQVSTVVLQLPKDSEGGGLVLYTKLGFSLPRVASRPACPCLVATGLLWIRLVGSLGVHGALELRAVSSGGQVIRTSASTDKDSGISHGSERRVYRAD